LAVGIFGGRLRGGGVSVAAEILQWYRLLVDLSAGFCFAANGAGIADVLLEPLFVSDEGLGILRSSLCVLGFGYLALLMISLDPMCLLTRLAS